jgi:ketosteroid isomerase-like protein
VNTPEPSQFAQDWTEAWNAHDLARILAHYADDVEMFSPYISLVLKNGRRSVQGRQELTEYWSRALALRPTLQFRLLSVHHGIGSIAVYYETNLTGRNVIETFGFNGSGLVRLSHSYPQA